MKEQPKDNDDPSNTAPCYPEGYFPLKKVEVRIKPLRLTTVARAAVIKRGRGRPKKSPSCNASSNIDSSENSASLNKGDNPTLRAQRSSEGEPEHCTTDTNSVEEGASLESDDSFKAPTSVTVSSSSDSYESDCDNTLRKAKRERRSLLPTLTSPRKSGGTSDNDSQSSIDREIRQPLAVKSDSYFDNESNKKPLIKDSFIKVRMMSSDEISASCGGSENRTSTSKLRNKLVEEFKLADIESESSNDLPEQPRQSADPALKPENPLKHLVVVDETAVSDDNSDIEEIIIADDSSPAPEGINNKKSSNSELSTVLKLPAGISVLPAASGSSSSSNKQSLEAAKPPSSFPYQMLPSSTTISIADNSTKQAANKTVEDQVSSKTNKDNTINIALSKSVGMPAVVTKAMLKQGIPCITTQTSPIRTSVQQSTDQGETTTYIASPDHVTCMASPNHVMSDHAYGMPSPQPTVSAVECKTAVSEKVTVARTPQMYPGFGTGAYTGANPGAYTPGANSADDESSENEGEVGGGDAGASANVWNSLNFILSDNSPASSATHQPQNGGDVIPRKRVEKKKVLRKHIHTKAKYLDIETGTDTDDQEFCTPRADQHQRSRASRDASSAANAEITSTGTSRSRIPSSRQSQSDAATAFAIADGGNPIPSNVIQPAVRKSRLSRKKTPSKMTPPKSSPNQPKISQFFEKSPRFTEEPKVEKEEVAAVNNISAVSGPTGSPMSRAIGSPMSGVDTDTDKFKEPEVIDISTPPVTTRNKSTKDEDITASAANNTSVTSEEAKSVRKSSRILDAQSASDTENVSVTNITEMCSDTDTSNRMDTSQEGMMSPAPARPAGPPEHGLGDLVWVRLGNYPWWPAMVTDDPVDNVCVRKYANSEKWEYHVSFLGEANRAWIVQRKVMPYKGKEGLMQKKQESISECKNTKYINTAFVPKPQQLEKWNAAIQGADKLLKQVKDDRLRSMLEFNKAIAQATNTSGQKHSPKPSGQQSPVSSKQSAVSSKQSAVSSKQSPVSSKQSAVSSKQSAVSSSSAVAQVDQKRMKRRTAQIEAVIGKVPGKVLSEVGHKLTAYKLYTMCLKVAKDGKAGDDGYCRKTWDDLPGFEKKVYSTNKQRILADNNSQESDDGSNRRSQASRRQHELQQLKEEKERKEAEKGPGWYYEVVPVKNSPKPAETAGGSTAAGADPPGDLLGYKKFERCCYKCEGVTNSEQGDVLKCKGVCGLSYHPTCCLDNKVIQIEGDQPAEDTFKCGDCLANRILCSLCGKQDKQIPTQESANAINDTTVALVTESESVKRCGYSAGCGRWFHPSCLTATPLWPQARVGSSHLICPAHMCHTCASDDPKNPIMKHKEKLVRCIRCPTAYHHNDHCMSAGTLIITKHDILCPKHFTPTGTSKKKNYHITASWCFMCSEGGSLICCEICPAAFHLECLKLDNPPEKYYCDNCETGRLPLYNEIVWVKIGAYRWWPAKVVPPEKVPNVIEKLAHSDGEFPVQFLGSGDYAWMNHGRAFLYEDGDSEKVPSHSSKSMDASFRKGLKLAEELYAAYTKDKEARDAKNAGKRSFGGNKPSPYVKLKINKAYGNCPVYTVDPQDLHPCDCNPSKPNPCGEDSNCINRMLMFECHPQVCNAGDKCENMRFQKRQYPDFKVTRVDGRGWGLYAHQLIKKGSFCIEYVGELITMDEYRYRMKQNQQCKEENYYYLTIDNNRMIDAGPKGNTARFMNHSCDPNCITQKWTINGDTRVGLFAIKDIPLGSELTFNYQLESVGDEKKPCLCGAANCSGFIGLKPRNEKEDRKKDQEQKKKEQKKQKKLKLKQQRDAAAAAREESERRKNLKIWESLCFRCHEGGSLIRCEMGLCPKVYHLGCIGKETLPRGKWHCPWHYCQECGKLVDGPNAWCIHCPSAYCRAHKDCLTNHPELSWMCNQHTEEMAFMLDVVREGAGGLAELLPCPNPTQDQLAVWKKARGIEEAPATDFLNSTNNLLNKDNKVKVKKNRNRFSLDFDSGDDTETSVSREHTLSRSGTPSTVSTLSHTESRPMSPSEQAPSVTTNPPRPSRTSNVQQPTAEKTKQPAQQKSSSQRRSNQSAATKQETIPSSDVLEAAKERLVEMTDTDDDTIDDIPEDNQDAALTSSIDDDMEIVVDDVVTDDTPTASVLNEPLVDDKTKTLDENSTRRSRTSNQKSVTPVIQTVEASPVKADGSSRQRSSSRSKPQAPIVIAKDDEKEASEIHLNNRSSRRRSNINLDTTATTPVLSSVAVPSKSSCSQEQPEAATPSSSSAVRSSQRKPDKTRSPVMVNKEKSAKTTEIKSTKPASKTVNAATWQPSSADEISSKRRVSAAVFTPPTVRSSRIAAKKQESPNEQPSKLDVGQSLPPAAKSAAPVIPPAAQVIAQAAPVIPQEVAAIPVAAPVIPVAAPVMPLAASVTPVAAPVIPLAASAIPVAAPVIPVAGPAIPIAAPVLPIAAPVIPVTAPIIPVAVPTPVIPPAEDVFKREDQVVWKCVESRCRYLGTDDLSKMQNHLSYHGLPDQEVQRLAGNILAINMNLKMATRTVYKLKDGDDTLLAASPQKIVTDQTAVVYGYEDYECLTDPECRMTFMSETQLLNHLRGVHCLMKLSPPVAPALVSVPPASVPAAPASVPAASALVQAAPALVQAAPAFVQAAPALVQAAPAAKEEARIRSGYRCRFPGCNSIMEWQPNSPTLKTHWLSHPGALFKDMSFVDLRSEKVLDIECAYPYFGECALCPEICTSMLNMPDVLQKIKHHWKACHSNTQGATYNSSAAPQITSPLRKVILSPSVQRKGIISVNSPARQGAVSVIKPAVSSAGRKIKTKSSAEKIKVEPMTIQDEIDYKSEQDELSELEEDAVTGSNLAVTGKNLAVTGKNLVVTGRNLAVTGKNLAVTGGNVAVTSVIDDQMVADPMELEGPFTCQYFKCKQILEDAQSVLRHCKEQHLGHSLAKKTVLHNLTQRVVYIVALYRYVIQCGHSKCNHFIYRNSSEDEAQKLMKNHWNIQHSSASPRDFIFQDLSVGHPDEVNCVSVDEPVHLSQSEGPYYCSSQNCDYSCTKWQMFSRHWNSKHPELDPSTAGFIDSSTQSYVTVFNFATVIMQCKLCRNMTTTNKRQHAIDQMEKHLNKNHPEVKDTTNVIDILKDEQGIKNPETGPVPGTELTSYHLAVTQGLIDNGRQVPVHTGHLRCQAPNCDLETSSKQILRHWHTAHENEPMSKFLVVDIVNNQRFTLHDLFKCVGECPNCGLYAGSNVTYEVLYKNMRAHNECKHNAAITDFRVVLPPPTPLEPDNTGFGFEIVESLDTEDNFLPLYAGPYFCLFKDCDFKYAGTDKKAAGSLLIDHWQLKHGDPLCMLYFAKEANCVLTSKVICVNLIQCKYPKCGKYYQSVYSKHLCMKMSLHLNRTHQLQEGKEKYMNILTMTTPKVKTSAVKIQVERIKAKLNEEGSHEGQQLASSRSGSTPKRPTTVIGSNTPVSTPPAPATASSLSVPETAPAKISSNKSRKSISAATDTETETEAEDYIGFDGPYVCSICSEEFPLSVCSNRRLVQHWQNKHGHPKDMVFIDKPTNYKLKINNIFQIVFECTQPGCYAVFGCNSTGSKSPISRTREKIKIHLNGKHPGVAYTCDEDMFRKVDVEEVEVENEEIVFSGPWKCNVPGCDFKLPSGNRAWRMTSLNHFILDHDDMFIGDMQILDVGLKRVLKIQQIFRYVGQCNIDGCFMIKGVMGRHCHEGKYELNRTFIKHFRSEHEDAAPDYTILVENQKVLFVRDGEELSKRIEPIQHIQMKDNKEDIKPLLAKETTNSRKRKSMSSLPDPPSSQAPSVSAARKRKRMSLANVPEQVVAELEQSALVLPGISELAVPVDIAETVYECEVCKVCVKPKTFFQHCSAKHANMDPLGIRVLRESDQKFLNVLELCSNDVGGGVGKCAEEGCNFVYMIAGKGQTGKFHQSSIKAHHVKKHKGKLVEAQPLKTIGFQCTCANCWQVLTTGLEMVEHLQDVHSDLSTLQTTFRNMDTHTDTYVHNLFKYVKECHAQCGKIFYSNTSSKYVDKESSNHCLNDVPQTLAILSPIKPVSSSIYGYQCMAGCGDETGGPSCNLLIPSGNLVNAVKHWQYKHKATHQLKQFLFITTSTQKLIHLSGLYPWSTQCLASACHKTFYLKQNSTHVVDAQMKKHFSIKHPRSIYKDNSFKLIKTSQLISDDLPVEDEEILEAAPAAKASSATTNEITPTKQPPENNLRGFSCAIANCNKIVLVTSAQGSSVAINRLKTHYKNKHENLPIGDFAYNTILKRNDSSPESETSGSQEEQDVQLNSPDPSVVYRCPTRSCCQVSVFYDSLRLHWENTHREYLNAAFHPYRVPSSDELIDCPNNGCIERKANQETLVQHLNSVHGGHHDVQQDARSSRSTENGAATSTTPTRPPTLKRTPKQDVWQIRQDIGSRMSAGASASKKAVSASKQSTGGAASRKDIWQTKTIQLHRCAFGGCQFASDRKNELVRHRREYGHGEVEEDLEAVVDGGVDATDDIEEDHASLNTPSTSNKRKITDDNGARASKKTGSGQITCDLGGNFDYSNIETADLSGEDSDEDMDINFY